MTGHIEQIRQRYDQFSRGDIQGTTQDWAGDTVAVLAQMLGLAAHAKGTAHASHHR
jgi:hypothetical protein